MSSLNNSYLVNRSYNEFVPGTKKGYFIYNLVMTVNNSRLPLHQLVLQ